MYTKNKIHVITPNKSFNSKEHGDNLSKLAEGNSVNLEFGGISCRWHSLFAGHSKKS